MSVYFVSMELFDDYKNETVESKEFESSGYISNIVASGDMNEEIVLSEVSSSVRFDVNQPEKFPAIVLKLDNNITSNVFESGAFVITGGDDFGDVETAYESLVDELSSILGNELESTLTIRNIVYTIQYKRDFNLETKVLQLGLNNCEYEPEQFGAIMYSMPANVGVNGGHALIFSSGAVNLVGGNTISDINKMKTHIEEVLELNSDGFYDV